VAKQTQAAIDAYLKRYIPPGSYYQTTDGEVRYYPMVPEPDPTPVEKVPAGLVQLPSPKKLVTSGLPAATPTPPLPGTADFVAVPEGTPPSSGTEVGEANRSETRGAQVAAPAQHETHTPRQTNHPHSRSSKTACLQRSRETTQDFINRFGS
jgi:hypothetical protein